MLEASGLAAFRGERLVFADIDVRVDAGGALLVLGANGAGKSTLLRVLAGLLRPAAGRMTWNGADMLADQAVRIGYLGHQDAIKPGLTVAENLRFAKTAGAGSVEDALAAMGLGPLAELPARLLSAGQRRRLALARLTLSAAPLWVLDEPTLGLDEPSVRLLAGLLADHRASGGLVVAATHLDLPLEAPGVLRMAA